MTVALAETTPQMKPGMSVRAEMLIEHRDDVLSVPIEAVSEREGVRHVWVRGGRGAWEERTVELGPESDTRVVVTAGLDGGEVVALVDPEQWARGERPGAAEVPESAGLSPTAPVSSAAAPSGTSPP